MNREKGPLIKTAVGLFLSNQTTLFFFYLSLPPKQDTWFSWHCLARSVAYSLYFPSLSVICLIYSHIVPPSLYLSHLAKSLRSEAPS